MQKGRETVKQSHNLLLKGGDFGGVTRVVRQGCGEEGVDSKCSRGLRESGGERRGP